MVNDDSIFRCTDCSKKSKHKKSFDKDNENKFTRPWFAWANSLFGTLIMKLYDDENLRRSLLFMLTTQKNILSSSEAEI